MNKQATDFALMAAAFSADHKMATQVCKLLADGDVNETVARKMLALVRDGKLRSATPFCSHWHWSYSQPITFPSTSTTWIGTTADTLTTMATTIAEDAA